MMEDSDKASKPTKPSGFILHPSSCILRRGAAWLGIDYHQYVHLLAASIRMDFRSEGLLPDGRGASSIPPLAISLAVQVMFSVMIVLLMAQSLGAGVFLGFLYSMVSLALVVLIQFGSTVVSPEDLPVLGARPVSPRTYFAVKFSNLMFYVGLFTLAMHLLPAAAGPFCGGPWYYPALHLAAAWLASLFTAGWLAALYGLLLRAFHHERFKDIITYGQVAFSFLIFLGYQILPRRLEALGAAGAADGPWLYLAPPYWFARLVALGLETPRGADAGLALLALGATAGACAVMMRALSLDYAEHLSRRSATRRGRAPEAPTARGRARRAHFHRLFLRDGLERAAFYLTAHMFGRSRYLKQQFYPNVGVILAVCAFNAFGSRVANPFVGPEVEWSLALGVPAVTFVMLGFSVLSLLPYSDEYRAGWVFDVAPVADRGRILAGVKKAVLVFFYPVPLLLNLGLFAWHWPWADALCHAAYGLIAGWLSLQAYALALSDLPFSQPPVKGRGPASVVLILFLLPVCIGGACVLQVWALKGWGRAGFLALCGGLLLLGALLDRLSNRVYHGRPLLTAERSS